MEIHKGYLQFVSKFHPYDAISLTSSSEESLLADFLTLTYLLGRSSLVDSEDNYLKEAF
jgi:hypothetical protein